MAQKTLPSPRSAQQAAGSARRGPARLARQRRPAWIVGSLILMAVAVLVNVYLFQSSDQRVVAVVMARDVPVGQQISRADLTSAQVAVAPAVQTIPGRRLAEVVGHWAAVGLRKGSLLSASEITGQAAPRPGQALVTVPLKPSQVPPGLAPGWEVRVISTPGTPDSSRQNGGPAPGAVPPDIAAVVDQVGEPTVEGTVTVSLMVAEGESVAVARNAAAGSVALVVTAKKG